MLNAPAESRAVDGDGAIIWWLLTIGALFAVLAYLFLPTAQFLADWWSKEEYSHGWLIVPVSAFVIWQRRDRIAACRSSGAWFGVVLVALGIALFLVGEAAIFRRIPVLAIVVILMGLGFAALGRSAMRFVWVPVLFLLFAMPLPGSIYVPLTLHLQFISSELGAAILQFVGVSVYLDGNIIDLGVYQLQVAEACSGLRYLFPLAAFGFLCAWMYKAPLWARAIILLSVIPITVAMNSFRIALTGIFIEYGSISLAEGFMHLFEGWIVFVASLAILLSVMWLIALAAGFRGSPLGLLDFDRLDGKHIDVLSTVGSSTVPRPLVVATCVILLAIPAHAAVSDRQQIIPVRPGLVTFPIVVGEWQSQPASLDQQTLAVLGSDDYLLSDFHNGDQTGRVNLWVAYYDEQIRDSAIHSPKDCLPGAGWEYVSFEQIDAPVTTADGRTFQLNRGLIANGQDQMLIYYWLEMRGRQLTSDLSLKLVNLWDSLTTGRSDGALVRLITPIAPGEKPEQADARLSSFLELSYPALEAHVGS